VSERLLANSRRVNLQMTYFALNFTWCYSAITT